MIARFIPQTTAVCATARAWNGQFASVIPAGSAPVPASRVSYPSSSRTAAARAMLGQPDEVVFRGDRAGGEFIAFWLRDGRVVAGMNVNVWDVNEHVQALIRARQQADVAALADPGTPLDRLAAELAPGR